MSLGDICFCPRIYNSHINMVMVIFQTSKMYSNSPLRGDILKPGSINLLHQEPLTFSGLAKHQIYHRRGPVELSTQFMALSVGKKVNTYTFNLKGFILKMQGGCEAGT